jgi:hypothetical protein
MTLMDLAQEVAQLRRMLAGVEATLASPYASPRALQDFKSMVDDLRTRVWAILSTQNAADPKAFATQFRLRRLRETVETLAADLRSGALAASDPKCERIASAMRAILPILERPAGAPPVA